MNPGQPNSGAERIKTEQEVLADVLRVSGIFVHTSIPRELSPEGTSGFQTIESELKSHDMDAVSRSLEDIWMRFIVDKPFVVSPSMRSDMAGILGNAHREIVHIEEVLKPVFRQEIIKGKKGIFGIGSKPDIVRTVETGNFVPASHAELVEGGTAEPATRFIYYVPPSDDWKDYSNRTGQMLMMEVVLPESVAKELREKIKANPAFIRTLFEGAMKERLLTQHPEALDTAVGGGDPLTPPYHLWDASQIYVQEADAESLVDHTAIPFSTPRPTAVTPPPITPPTPTPTPSPNPPPPNPPTRQPGRSASSLIASIHDAETDIKKERQERVEKLEMFEVSPEAAEKDREVNRLINQISSIAQLELNELIASPNAPAHLDDVARLEQLLQGWTKELVTDLYAKVLSIGSLDEKVESVVFSLANEIAARFDSLQSSNQDSLNRVVAHYQALYDEAQRDFSQQEVIVARLAGTDETRALQESILAFKKTDLLKAKENLEMAQMNANEALGKQKTKGALAGLIEKNKAEIRAESEQTILSMRRFFQADRLEALQKVLRPKVDVFNARFVDIRRKQERAQLLYDQERGGLVDAHEQTLIRDLGEYNTILTKLEPVIRDMQAALQSIDRVLGKINDEKNRLEAIAEDYGKPLSERMQLTTTEETPSAVTPEPAAIKKSMWARLFRGKSEVAVVPPPIVVTPVVNQPVPREQEPVVQETAQTSEEIEKDKGLVQKDLGKAQKLLKFIYYYTPEKDPRYAPTSEAEWLEFKTQKPDEFRMVAIQQPYWLLYQTAAVTFDSNKAQSMNIPRIQKDIIDYLDNPANYTLIDGERVYESWAVRKQLEAMVTDFVAILRRAFGQDKIIAPKPEVIKGGGDDNADQGGEEGNEGGQQRRGKKKRRGNRNQQQGNT